MVIKDKDLLRYIGYCVKLMADDVMEVTTIAEDDVIAGYEVSHK